MSSQRPSSPQSVIHLLDDDPDHRERLGRLLSPLEARLQSYPCAESFLARNPKTVPGCLVATARLPGMSGLDLVRRLKAERRALPSLLVVDPGEVTLAVSALKIGVEDVIEKPVPGPLLLDRVHRLLEIGGASLLPRPRCGRQAMEDGGA